MAKKEPTLYKILEGNEAPYAEFGYRQFLPHAKEAGPWLPPAKGKLQRCVNGYHLTEKPEDWAPWLDRPTIYVAEGKVERPYAKQEPGENKRVFRSIRLLRKVPRKEWSDGWKARSSF
jgi:hypothetical protein